MFLYLFLEGNSNLTMIILRYGDDDSKLDEEPLEILDVEGRKRPSRPTSNK